MNPYWNPDAKDLPPHDDEPLARIRDYMLRVADQLNNGPDFSTAEERAEELLGRLNQ